MKRKYLMTAGAAVLSMGLLAGCGAPKSDALVDKMFEEDLESFAADIDLDVDVTADVGEEFGVTLSGGVQMEYAASGKDEVSTHMTTDLKYTVDAAGNKESDKLKAEFYAISEDDEIKSYSNTDGDGWILSTSELEENPLDDKTREKMLDEIKDILKTGEVQKKAVKVGDEDCWVLKLNTNMDAFMGLFEIALEASGEEDTLESAGVDNKTVEEYLAFLNMDLTVYASKKTGQCVKVEMDMAGSDTEGLLEKVGDEYGAMLSMFGLDLDSAEIDIKAMSFTIEISDWNAVEVEVPKKVTEEAVDVSSGYSWDGEGSVATPEVPEVTEVQEVPADGGVAVAAADTLQINGDGSVQLYDYNGEYIADVYTLDGYELDEDSDPTYLMYMDDDWNYYTVGTTVWEIWDDVVANGAKITQDDGDYYYQVYDPNYDDATDKFMNGEIESGSTVKGVLDLGFKATGIDGNAYPVYACMSGEWDNDLEADDGTQGDFSYVNCTIEFRYDDDDDWVVISLPSWDDVKNWEAEDYEAVYDQIFNQ